MAIPQTAEQMFEESVKEVARQRFNEMTSDASAQGETASDARPGHIARELLRRGKESGTCHGLLATRVFNILQRAGHDDPAQVAVEAEAFPAFCALVRASDLSEAEKDRAYEKYEKAITDDLDIDTFKQVGGLVNGAAMLQFMKQPRIQPQGMTGFDIG